jgi:hypothetical protein
VQNSLGASALRSEASTAPKSKDFQGGVLMGKPNQFEVVFTARTCLVNQTQKRRESKPLEFGAEEEARKKTCGDAATHQPGRTIRNPSSFDLNTVSAGVHHCSTTRRFTLSSFSFLNKRFSVGEWRSFVPSGRANPSRGTNENGPSDHVRHSKRNDESHWQARSATKPAQGLELCIHSKNGEKLGS